MQELNISQFTKERIRKIVQSYIEANPVEYHDFLDQQRLLREGIINEMASVKSVDHRPLFDLPETLYKLLLMRLTDVELMEFKSKKGARWFAKTFKGFAVATEI